MLAILRPLRYIVPFVAFVAGLPGIISYFPRISISAKESVREHEAMGTIFEVNNGGIFPLEAVRIDCALDSLTNPQGRQRAGGFTIHKPESDVGEIEAGGSRSAPCENLFMGFTEENALFSIRVSYRPAYWPFRKGKEFNMESERTDQGMWIWKQVGTSSFPPPK